MKVAAYNFATGDGQKPNELKILEAIDRFGVRAVLGRDVLSAGEMARAQYAEYIVSAYRARARAETWPEFTKQNPAAARILNEAERLANE